MPVNAHWFKLQMPIVLKSYLFGKTEVQIQKLILLMLAAGI